MAASTGGIQAQRGGVSLWGRGGQLRVLVVQQGVLGTRVPCSRGGQTPEERAHGNRGGRAAAVGANVDVVEYLETQGEPHDGEQRCRGGRPVYRARPANHTPSQGGGRGEPRGCKADTHKEGWALSVQGGSSTHAGRPTVVEAGEGEGSRMGADALAGRRRGHGTAWSHTALTAAQTENR
jgi:hypothetical protein